MTGPNLQPWQREYHATPEDRAWLAREFDNPRHVPERTCYGCGGTKPDRWYAQCHGWGVEAWRATGQPPDDKSPIYVEVFRLSWAEVRSLAAAEGVQQELAL